jgi:hypothetical protein
MRRPFKIVVVMCFLLGATLFSQVKPAEKYDEMMNAFLLGLENRGLEACLDIISRDEYKAVRPNAVFQVAEYFLSKGNQTNRQDDRLQLLKQAYTYYKTYEKDYPAGEYRQIVKARIAYIESTEGSRLLFGSLLGALENERQIVNQKLAVGNFFIEILPPNANEVFLNSDFNQTPVEMANRYYDEIIVNHPLFDIFAYYRKIIIYLDPFSDKPFLKETLVPYSRPRAKGFTSDSESNLVAECRQKAIACLDTLDRKYPHHPVTLDLHLVFAKLFMKKKSGLIDGNTLKHLNFILKNEEDRMSARYIIAKEFILNNRFDEQAVK